VKTTTLHASSDSAPLTLLLSLPSRWQRCRARTRPLLLLPLLTFLTRHLSPLCHSPLVTLLLSPPPAGQRCCARTSACWTEPSATSKCERQIHSLPSSLPSCHSPLATLLLSLSSCHSPLSLPLLLAEVLRENKRMLAQSHPRHRARAAAAPGAGEEAHPGDQEDRQAGTDGGYTLYLVAGLVCHLQTVVEHSVLLVEGFAQLTPSAAPAQRIAKQGQMVGSLTPSHPHTSHPHTLTPSHPHTLTPSHPHTLTPSHPHTLTPSHLTPSHPHTLTPSHPHTSHPHTSHPHTSHPHTLTPSHPLHPHTLTLSQPLPRRPPSRDRWLVCSFTPSFSPCCCLEPEDHLCRVEYCVFSVCESFLVAFLPWMCSGRSEGDG